MNNTMVREIHEAKINPKSSLKNYGAQNTRTNTVLLNLQEQVVHEEVTL
jgi:hypothetical protein